MASKVIKTRKQRFRTCIYEPALFRQIKTFLRIDLSYKFQMITQMKSQRYPIIFLFHLQLIFLMVNGTINCYVTNY